MRQARCCDKSRRTNASTLRQSRARHPANKWKGILSRTIVGFSHYRIASVAAGVTFYAILAIFPGIAAMISLYGLFADTGSISSQLSNLSGSLHGDAAEIIRGELTHLVAQKTRSLGTGFFIGIGIALWSASGGVKALFDALNVVYDEEEKRSFVKRAAIALLFTAGSIVFLLIALGAVVVLPIVLNFVGLGDLSDIVMRIIRWPVLFVLTALAFAFFYRYGPCRSHGEWRLVTRGSALAAILWVFVSLLFSWYVENFRSYNRIYGSLGAIVGFMTWIWLSIIIFLFGAEFDSEIECQTDQDGTTGQNRQLGAGEATVD